MLEQQNIFVFRITLQLLLIWFVSFIESFIIEPVSDYLFCEHKKTENSLQTFIPTLSNYKTLAETDEWTIYALLVELELIRLYWPYKF